MTTETRLLLLADTHIPPRARAMPAQVWDEVARADVVLHAGDWVEEAILDQLGARSRRLVGVWGNNDGDDLRARLPEVAHVTLDGVRFAVVHETGQAAGRERRCAAVYPDVDVLVVIAPLTPETEGIVGAEALSRLPDGALVVNVARGRLVDTDALLAETSSGRLRAAPAWAGPAAGA